MKYLGIVYKIRIRKEMTSVLISSSIYNYSIEFP